MLLCSRLTSFESIYVSYFRHMEWTCDLDEWYVFDDSTGNKVMYTKVKSVAESNAYLLLYVPNDSYHFMKMKSYSQNLMIKQLQKSMNSLQV